MQTQHMPSLRFRRINFRYVNKMQTLRNGCTVKTSYHPWPLQLSGKGRGFFQVTSAHATSGPRGWKLERTKAEKRKRSGDVWEVHWALGQAPGACVVSECITMGIFNNSKRWARTEFSTPEVKRDLSAGFQSINRYLISRIDFSCQKKSKRIITRVTRMFFFFFMQ